MKHHPIFQDFFDQCVETAAVIGREVQTDFSFVLQNNEQTILGMRDFDYLVNCRFYPETEIDLATYSVDIEAIGYGNKVVFESGFQV